MTSSTDQPQLGLPGLNEPAEPVHRLFFALLPDDAARAQAAGVADTLRTANALQARWVDPSRYHVTLAFLGDHTSLRPALLEAAATAASRLRVAPFTWSPDRVESFKGRRPPCVLRSVQVSQPLQVLWGQLRRALATQRLDRQMERNFQPHLTLAYSQHPLLAPHPVGPVAWSVEHVVLLHSELGAGGGYEELGRWSLPG